MPTRKSNFSLPRPRPAVVENFDPAEAEAKAPAAPVKAPSDSINFEPIDYSALETKPLPQYAAPPPPLPPPPPTPDPLEAAVPASLLQRLEQRFSVQKTFAFTIEIAQGSLALECRPRSFDDYLWAIDEITREYADAPTAGALGEGARSTLANHVSACRCVYKIEGEWVWDVFGLRQEIQAVQPKWSGETPFGMPEFYINVIARKVLALFRYKLHPDLLFSLGNALQKEEETRQVPPIAT